jgi:hypothetical protein
MFRLHGTAETCSFIDYYNKVLCMGGFSYCHVIYISEEVMLTCSITMLTRDKIIDVCDSHS